MVEGGVSTGFVRLLDSMCLIGVWVGRRVGERGKREGMAVLLSRCLFHPVGSRVSKGAARKRPSEADLSTGAVREKKKRKQKPRLPKNFDPENPGPKPDPERWLPKWQRSDFKKKRNRRREKASSILKRSLVKLCTET